MKNHNWGKYLSKGYSEKIRNLFRPGRFVRNVADRLVGNVTAQIIIFFSTPLITRIYSPADFGDMTLIWTYVGILSVISCLKYENAIILEKEKDKANNLFFLCLFISLILGFVIVILVFFLKNELTSILQFGGNSLLLYFIPAGMVCFGFFNSLNFLYTTNKRFSILSACIVVGALASVVIKLLAGTMLSASPVWLLFGNTSTLLIPVLILAFYLVFDNTSAKPKSPSVNSIIKLSMIYKDFPLLHAPTGLINTFSQNVMVLVLAFFFNSKEVGYYGLANSILRRPIGLISDSLSNIFLKDLADKQNSNIELRKSLVKTGAALFLIGIIPFSIITIFGKYVFVILFGEGWERAGLYSQILSPWLFIYCINTPFTQVVIVKKKLKFNFYYNIINIISKVILISIAAFFFKTPEVAIGLFSCLGFILNLFYIYYAFSLTK